MAKLELETDEQVLAEGTWFMPKGRRVRFPVSGRHVIANRRFLYRDFGRMAALFTQLGIPLRLFIRGRMAGLSLQGVRLRRGSTA